MGYSHKAPHAHGHANPKMAAEHGHTDPTTQFAGRLGGPGDQLSASKQEALRGPAKGSGKSGKKS